MSEITVTISGPVGCGKSAIAGEIEIALKAIGVPVRYVDKKAARSEKNMTGADWTSYLEMYKPSVVLVEQINQSEPSLLSLKRDMEAMAKALEDVIDRAMNGELGTSKVLDMKRIARTALDAYRNREGNGNG